MHPPRRVFHCITQSQNACKVMLCSAFVVFSFTSFTSSSTSNAFYLVRSFRPENNTISRVPKPVNIEYRGWGQQSRPIFFLSQIAWQSRHCVHAPMLHPIFREEAGRTRFCNAFLLNFFPQNSLVGALGDTKQKNRLIFCSVTVFHDEFMCLCHVPVRSRGWPGRPD